MVSLLPRVQRILDSAATTPVVPTGVTHDTYLDRIERILDLAVKWQDERGAIIDPVAKVEHGQTSCRFVSPGAVLLAAGRGEHLRENVLRGMDWCCRRLASGAGESPDFWMRELMTAYAHLKDVDPARRKRWADDLSAVDCEKVYKFVSPDGSKLLTLHNWTVYASGGEAMRQMAGLGPQGDSAFLWGKRFFEKYMPAQMTHFTDLGMYRDPADPMTYDMTTRLQIEVPLALGFQSPSTPKLRDLLDRGMLAQLLYVSPEGFAPFGGRSNQLHMQEAILAANCEIAARRYRESDPRLARAFKRQAHLHTRSVSRWLDMMPMRHIKNGFDPSLMHGCENYAKYSVYSLFFASCLALAYQFADESIDEGPCPSEIGGYALELKEAFHKVFATVGKTQIEIDTAADLHYDATGLGRFHRAGVPLELGLSMPFPAHPNYHVPKELLPANDLSIAPGWCIGQIWHELAPLHENLSVETQVERESLEEVIVRIVWTHERTTLHQRYRLTPGEVQIDAEVIAADPVRGMRFTIPLLRTDGTHEAKLSETPGAFTLTHPLGGTYAGRFDQRYRTSKLAPAANRNGVYVPFVLETSEPRVSVTLSLTV